MSYGAWRQESACKLSAVVSFYPFYLYGAQQTELVVSAHWIGSWEAGVIGIPSIYDGQFSRSLQLLPIDLLDRRQEMEVVTSFLTL